MNLLSFLPLIYAMQCQLLGVLCFEKGTCWRTLILPPACSISIYEHHLELAFMPA